MPPLSPGDSSLDVPRPEVQVLPCPSVSVGTLSVAGALILLLHLADWQINSAHFFWFLLKAVALALLVAWCNVYHRRNCEDREQIQGTLAEAEQRLQGALDALSSPVAVLGADGTVANVNRAWREWGKVDPTVGVTENVGANYLHSTTARPEAMTSERRTLEQGIRLVLSGEEHAFSLGYVRVSPEGERRFLLRATRADFGHRRGVVISQEEVTDHKVFEAEIQRLKAEQFVQARRDSLTGLGNRLQLQEDLEVMKARLERYGHAYSVVLMDIDHFKTYNDRYGHGRGDEVLEAVSGVIRQHCRKGDTAYRHGGEEFMLILPEQSAEEAAVAANRILRAVEELEIPHLTNMPAGLVTVSAGVSSAVQNEARTVEELIEEADDALYIAKQSGRNRVRTHQPLAVPPK